jgi:hypothetical protein
MQSKLELEVGLAGTRPSDFAGVPEAYKILIVADITDRW